MTPTANEILLAVLAVAPTVPGHDLTKEQNPIHRLVAEAAGQRSGQIAVTATDHLVVTAPTASLALELASDVTTRLPEEAGLASSTVRFGLTVAESPAQGAPHDEDVALARSLAGAAADGGGVAGPAAKLLAREAPVWGPTVDAEGTEGVSFALEQGTEPPEPAEAPAAPIEPEPAPPVESAPPPPPPEPEPTPPPPPPAETPPPPPPPAPAPPPPPPPAPAPAPPPPPPPPPPGSTPPPPPPPPPPPG